MHRKFEAEGEGAANKDVSKNYDFVSESINSVRPNSIKITADGEVKKINVVEVVDYHLDAQLVLPELKERCAGSSCKELYELSALLAEETATEPEAEPIGNTNQLNKNKLIIETPKIPMRPANKPNEKPMKNRKVHFLNTDLKNDEAKAKRNAERKKLTKTRKTKRPYRKIESNSSDENNEKLLIERNPTKPLTLKPEPIYMVHQEHVAEPRPSQIQRLPKLKVRKDRNKWTCLAKKLTSLHQLMVSEKRAREITDLVQLPVLMGISAYLIYILGQDVSKYMNAESHYKILMETSGFFRKCFYFTMHMLKVPIF